MEEIPTSWDVDDIDESLFEQLRQYEPTEKELEEVEKEREPKKVKLGELLNNIADYALKYVDETTYFSRVKGQQETNPLEEGPPYEMNNASFVYWCFAANNIYLPNGKLNHSVHSIKSSERLGEIYGIGSKVNQESLVRGDILLFNNDKHIGIYVGEGDFVSMNGPRDKNSVGGVYKNNINDKYWSRLFQGHVIRFLG